MSESYEDLAERAVRGGLRVKPGTVVRGEVSASQAQELLMAATATNTLEDMTHVVLGRPKVGSAGKGASPTVRARVPQELKDGVTLLAVREGRNESDIIRDALAAYVRANA